MTSNYRTYWLFAFAGACAGALGLPIISGHTDLPSYLTGLTSGIIFSILMILATILALPKIWSRVSLPKWIIFGASLAIGMPIALMAGFAVLGIVDHFASGIQYHFGAVGFPFFCAEIASCLIWSLVLVLCLYLISRSRVPKFMMICCAVTISVMAGFNLVEIISTMLFKKSILLPLTSVGEQIASASILASGMSHRSRIQEIDSAL